MPEKANQHARSAKKRKTQETLFSRDGCDSSFASIYRDSNGEFHHPTQRGAHLVSNGNGLQEIRQPEAIKAPPTHQTEGVSLNYPINNCLKEHMESIMNELKEAREKLLQWMRQEIQAVSAMADERRASRVDVGKRKQQVDRSSNTDSIGVQTVAQGGQACEGGRLGKRQDHSKHEAGEPQVAANAQEGYVHDRASYDIPQKDPGMVSAEPKSKIFGMATNSGSGTTSKTVNKQDQGLPTSNMSGKAGLGPTKVDSPVQNTTNKLPTESKSALFDMCFGAGLGEDVRDVEGLNGTLESGVTIREGLEFNKANHDIQNSLDRLCETKSPLLDMGFEDEESNEGNGVGCSLESAASSKVNSGFSKVGNGIQSGFGRGFDTGFAARFGEQGKDHTGLDDGIEGAANSADVYGSSKVKKEVPDVVMTETKHAVVNKGLVNSIRGERVDEESRQVDRVMGAKSVQASLKGSQFGGGFPPQSSQGFPPQNSQPGDVQQQAGISARSGCGIKRSYGTAMTFKGSALESKNDVLNVCQGNPSFADVFNSANSSIIVMKKAVQAPAADKGKVESLALHNESNTSGTPAGSAPAPGPAWNMFTASKNAMNQTLHDSKFAHLEYASRSKLGDAIVGSGRTVDFTGFDPMFGYASQYKSATEMMDVYQQQERANTSSMYFSSLSTNNSGYLPTSNRVVGMQRPPPSTPPSSSSALRPMLMGMPGHVGAHHDPSNMHTFLGLGMNGVSATANGMQVFPGLYLQSNQQQHSQASFKHAPSSTSPMVSHQESSGGQEKAVLELNFG
eukprot:c20645_g1_i1 orf=672-3044(+)